MKLDILARYDIEQIKIKKTKEKKTLHSILAQFNSKNKAVKLVFFGRSSFSHSFVYPPQSVSKPHYLYKCFMTSVFFSV